MGKMSHECIYSQFFGIIVILLLIISAFPLISFFGEEIPDFLSQQEPLAVSHNIPSSLRLMNHPIGIFSNESILGLNDALNQVYIPSYFVGEQIGKGGDNFEINDTAVLYNSSEQILNDIHWRSNPEEHENDISITIPSYFFNKTGQISITNVSAVPDWRLIENVTSSPTSRASTLFYSIAQEFKVVETYINLTKISLYIDMIDDNDLDSLKPSADFLILGDSSGSPDKASLLGTLSLEGHSSLSGLSDGGDWVASTNGWLQYSFTPGVLLSKGTYWFVLNDTKDGGLGSWNWYTKADGSGNPDKGTWKYILFSHSNSFSDGDSSDVIMMPQVLPVELSATEYVNKKYDFPSMLNFTYFTSIDSTNLKSFIWFNMNLTSINLHKFSSNTSISFILEFRLQLIFFNNPRSPLSSYCVDNSTDTFWNLTFTSTKIDTVYSIKNRSIILSNLPSDWNGSKIYWNESITPEYSQMVNNPNITWDGNSNHKYTFGNTSIYINASTLTENITWIILFNSTNYFTGFSLKEDSIPLKFPYSANLTDLIELEFSLGYTGNVSYWIDYPNGTRVLSYTDINNTHTNFSDLWDINSTVDQNTNVNGTYLLQAFWHNAEKTQIGTYTRSLLVYINTSLQVSTDLEVVIGQKVNVSALYITIHNSSKVLNAPILCSTNWTSNIFMNQLEDLSYNASFFTNGLSPGEYGLITVTSQMPWFVNWTKSLLVKFIGETSLLCNVTELNIQWRENSTLRIYYNDSNDNFIPEASIRVGSDAENIMEGLGAYYYKLNSTDYPGIGYYSGIIINASHNNYVSKEIVFNLNITVGVTNISAYIRGIPISNTTGQISVYFANSSADSITLNLNYYQILTGRTLNIVPPDIDSYIPHNSGILESNDTWSITFDPNKTGTFLISISFSKINFLSQTFVFNLTILHAETEIYNEIPPGINIYFEEPVDFFLLYNNTNYNENITGLLPPLGIVINDTFVSFLNRTGDYYWFRIQENPIPIGLHTTNITFTHSFFNPAISIITYVIINRPSDINCTINNVPLANNSGVIQIYYANSSSDSFSLNFMYYDFLNSTILDTTAPSIESPIEMTILFKEGNYSWTLIFNPNQTGIFIINVSFSLSYYDNAKFILSLEILRSATSIYEELPPIVEIYYNTVQDFFLIYNNTLYNENITGLTEGDGISLNNTNIAFLNRTGALYWFQITPIPISVGIHSTNITFSYLYFESSSFIIIFDVKIHPTDIVGQQGKNIIINDSTIISKYYANSSIDTITVNFEYQSGLTGLILNTFAPNIESNLIISTVYQEINLSWTIFINPNQTGIYLINLTFTMANYQNSSFILHITILKATTTIYDSLPPLPQIFFDESEDFYLLYSNTIYNEYITGLILGIGIIINNLKISFLNRTGDYYWFRISPNSVEVGIHETNITFSHPYFISSSFVFSFEILNRLSSINCTYNQIDIQNDSTTIQTYFANSSADLLIFNFDYYDYMNGTTLETSTPVIDSSIAVVNIAIELNLTWTITFNPNQTGNFLINLTFTLLNYENSFFILRIEILQSPTSIYNELPPISSLYYDTTLDFFLMYNNTYYNENITGLTEGNGITLNNTKLAFLNRTGDLYWFRMTPTPVSIGIHATRITFFHPYFETSNEIVIFEITAHPTDISGQQGSLSLINDSSIINQYYANSSADSITINFEYTSGITGQILSTASPLISSLLNISTTIKEVNYSWTIVINPNQTGIFILNFTFILSNYHSATFLLHISILVSDTEVINPLTKNFPIYYDESSDFYLIYNNTIYNENITGLSEGTGININNTKVSYLNRTGDIYWFRLSPTTLVLGSHSSNISFFEAYFESSYAVIIFEVIQRPTGINVTYNLSPIQNNSLSINLSFSNTSKDCITFHFLFYDDLNNSVLNILSPSIDSSVPITSLTEETNFTWMLILNPNQTGVFLINLTFTLGNYEDALFILHLEVIKASTSLCDELYSSPSIYYDTQQDFFLVYNNTIYNENITGLTGGDGIIINNTKVEFLNRTGDFYWFRLTPNAIPVGLHATNITFYHPYFETSVKILIFEVIEHPTKIQGYKGILAIINDTTTIIEYYANSTADIITINFEFASALTSQVLETDQPLVESSLALISLNEELNFSWTLIINPNQTGNYLINLSFSLINYQSCIFILHISIIPSATILNDSLTSSPEIYYSETLEFYLVYNNINYNENITGLSFGEGIIINNSKAFYLNRTGDIYWFQLSPTTIPVGSHGVNITFYHQFFLSSSFIISFTVLLRPSSVNGSYNLFEVINDSSIIDIFFSNSSLDSFSINLAYFDARNGSILDVFIPNVDSLVPIQSINEELNLSWTIGFNPNQTGQYIINFTFNLNNYESAVFILYLHVIKSSTDLIDNLGSSTEIYFDTYFDFYLIFNNTVYNENITGLSFGFHIYINNTKVSYQYKVNEFYWFRINSDISTIGLHASNITFNHPDFVSSSFIVQFEVIIHPTSLNAYDGRDLLENNTSEITVKYANTSADSIIINLQYISQVNSTILISDSPVIESSIEIFNLMEETNHSWTVIFNPNHTGELFVNFNFNTLNFQSMRFILKIIILPSETALYISQTATFNLYYMETTEFYMVYNNTDYNENITGLTLYNGILINNSYVTFINRTANVYWFQIGSLSLVTGSYATNISFYNEYFINASVIITLNVLTRPTNISTFEAINFSSLFNETSIITRNYSPSYYDNISLIIRFYDLRTNSTINSSGYFLEIDPTIHYSANKDPLNFYWTFVFNGSVIGSYRINVTYSIANYDSCTFSFTYTINPAQSILGSSSITPVPTVTNVKVGNEYYFWVVWVSEYNEALNASNGVIINSTDIVLIQTDETIGNHTFRFNTLLVGILTYNLTFSIVNYSHLVVFMRFNTFNRTMMIDNTLSLPANDQTVDFLQWGEIFYFYVFINDSESKDSLDTTILLIDSRIDFIGIQTSGNHSFIFNATEIGSFYDLIITFSKNNYETLSYIISFIVAPREVVLSPSLSTHNVIDYLQYGDVFNIFIFINDSRTYNQLNATNYLESPPPLAFQRYTIEQGHLFEYIAGNLGYFTLNVNFSLPNYVVFTFQINITVTRGTSILIPSEIEITAVYSQDTDFSVLWNSTPNPLVNTSPILPILNTSNLLFSYDNNSFLTVVSIKQIGLGVYIFTINPNIVGVTTLFITFSSSYYLPDPISVNISIRVNQCPTIFLNSTYLNNSVIGESEPYYYNHLMNFTISWVDLYTSMPIFDSLLIISENLTGLVTFIHYEGGMYFFVLNALKIGVFTFNVEFETREYSANIFALTVEISYIPTLDPDFTAQSNITVGEDVEVHINSWKSIEDKIVDLESIMVYIDSMIIQFTHSSLSSYPIEVFSSTDDLEKGIYNFTIICESYGYENKTFSFLIDLRGRNLILEVTILPENIIQGDDLTIKVEVSYASLVGIGSALELASLANLAVTYTIYIKYKNNTSIRFSQTIYTDSNGIAEYIISGRYTIDATKFDSIDITTEATSSSNLGFYSAPRSILDAYIFNSPPPIGFPDELILVILLIASLVIGIPSIFIAQKKLSYRKRTIAQDSESFSKVEMERKTEQPTTRTESVQQEKTQLKPKKLTPSTRPESTEFSIDNHFPISFRMYRAEIQYLFSFVLERKGRWFGQTSLNYLTKQVPVGLSKENLRKLYQLLPEETEYFEKGNNFIKITEKGQEIASKILKVQEIPNE